MECCIYQREEKLTTTFLRIEEVVDSPGLAINSGYQTNKTRKTTVVYQIKNVKTKH